MLDRPVRLLPFIVILPVLAVGWGDARGDDPISVREGHPVRSNDAEEVPPPVRFDGSLLAVDIASVGDRTLALAPSRSLTLELTGSWRAAPDDRVRGVGGASELVRWWTAGAGASYDLRWARVEAHATYGHEENELGRGDSVDVGVALTRTHRLSPDVIGFVSLSLGGRRWLGQTPPGQFGGGQVMLTAGVHWK
jgi:hypothetical protein